MSEFPSIFESEKIKNKEEYHRNFVMAIARRSLNSTYALGLSVMDNCYRFYENSQGSGNFNFMQQAPDGSQLPAQWATLGKIRPKINLMIGELMEKGYDLKVNAINKEAKSRKLEEKEKLRVDIRLKPIMGDMQDVTGLPSNHNESIPDSEDELDEFFEKTYKEISEIVLYYALKFLDKKNLWMECRASLFRDVLIAGKAFAKLEIVNGVPKARRVDPRYIVYDSYSENDFLTDSTYFGEVRYMNIADAAAKYNIPIDKLKEAANNYSEFIKYSSRDAQGQMAKLDMVSFPSLSGSGLSWFKSENTGLRVLVLEACWVDYQVSKHKISEDNYGTEHFKEISDQSKDKENVISKRVKVWRKGTLVGGTELCDWGLIKNQTRDVDNLSETYPPYCAVIPHFVNGKSVSIVEQLQSLQNFKDILFFNTQLAISRAGARGFVYDVSQCPEGWEPETVIKYLKTVGIAFIDSRAGGTPSQFNQFQQLDLSLSASVEQFMKMSIWADEEMDTISGINNARQGIVQGASQLASVTQSALIQSSLTTASYFHLFNQFTTNIWNQMARLVKISWKGKEKYAAIIGDAGVNFLEQDVDLDLNDYGVFVTETPKLLDDKNTFNNLIMSGLQSGEVKLPDALILLMEPDVKSGILKFEKITRKREKEAIAAEQAHEKQMAQMQQQSQLEAQDRMAQNNARTSQEATEKAKELQGMKDQAATTRELLGGRIKLQSDKINALSAQEVAKQKNNEKKTKEK